MALARSKSKSPFAPDQVVRAARTFAWADGVIHIGEEYRGADKAVQENWTAFVDGETLDQELENVWETLPPPPQHAPEVAVQTIQIAPHRQVRSLVDVSVPMAWSPDSPGAKSGVPPPFARTALRRGQLVDALHPIVREHVDWFVWPERHVLLEDLERLERLEREGVNMAKKIPTSVANQPPVKVFPNPPASSVQQALANSKKQVAANK